MKRYKRSLIVAGAVFFVDAFVFSQGVIAMLTLFIALFAGIPRAFWVFKDKPVFHARLIRVFIYTFAGLAALGVVRLDNATIDRRANKLIAACDQYQTKYHAYPDTLQKLVPEFLIKIPAARYALMYNNFYYFNRPDDHMLMYVGFPPFGRSVYHLETRRWGRLD